MKFIAVLMIFTAAAFFSTGEAEAFIPGCAFFSAGMWLLVRRPRPLPPPAATPELESRLQALESEVLLLNQELARAKDELGELTAERDFLRQLYSAGSAASKAAGLPSA